MTPRAILQAASIPLLAFAIALLAFMGKPLVLLIIPCALLLAAVTATLIFGKG